MKFSIPQKKNENIQISNLHNLQMNQENLSFHIQIDKLEGGGVEEKEHRNS